MERPLFFRSISNVFFITWSILLHTAEAQTVEFPAFSRNQIYTNELTLLGTPPHEQIRFMEWREDQSFDEFLTNFTGKVVYADIWASWCGPCLAEIPYAQELKAGLARESVVFLYISVDTDEQAWYHTIDRFGMAGVHIRLDEKRRNPFQDAYHIKGYPTYLIFDKEGKLVKNNAGWPSEKRTIKSIRKKL